VVVLQLLENKDEKHLFGHFGYTFGLNGLRYQSRKRSCPHRQSRQPGASHARH
jgi:hypothetical protein